MIKQPIPDTMLDSAVGNLLKEDNAKLVLSILLFGMGFWFFKDLKDSTHIIISILCFVFAVMLFWLHEKDFNHRRAQNYNLLRHAFRKREERLDGLTLDASIALYELGDALRTLSGKPVARAKRKKMPKKTATHKK